MTNLPALLAEQRLAEALALCTQRSDDPVTGAYYRFWLHQLRAPVAAAAAVTPSATAPTLQAEGALQGTLPRPLHPAFAAHPYTLADEALPPEAEMEATRASLVASSPFKGEIYQPTAKIALADQVRGLRRVRALTSAANLAASRSRFDILKRAVQERGMRRAFVIGNGPSLKQTDLALLRDELTIGFNGIFLHASFTPTIYVVEDHLVAEDRIAEIHAYRCPVKMFPSYLGYCIEPQDNTIFLNHRPRISFPVDTDFSNRASEITYTGGTVTYTGLQIAASLGLEEIILLGVDASYQVHDVERSETYGTGVLTSKSDDTNHFDPRYFGKGYRWHDPNVHTMLQAYRKAREHGRDHGLRIVNAGLGGQLEVFARVDFLGLFAPQRSRPRLAVLDFTPHTRLCATGLLKRHLLRGWPRPAQLHVHADAPLRVSAFQSMPGDLYARGSDNQSVWPPLRSLVEFDPEVLYLRPTADRPTLTVLQAVCAAVLGRPWVLHVMDDWLARARATLPPAVAQAHAEVLAWLLHGATHVLAISDKMGRLLVQRHGLPPSRVEVIHNYMPPAPGRPAAAHANSHAHAHAHAHAQAQRTLRYCGGLEPDMGLSSLVEVARQVQAWNARGDGPALQFVIHAAQGARERHGGAFDGLEGTVLAAPIEDDAAYLEALAASDLNLIAYNFDEDSLRYVRHSLANKLPELLACGAPFLAIGHPEVGTMELLRDAGWPLLATAAGFDLSPLLAQVLQPDEAFLDRYRAAVALLQDEFAEHRHRSRFQALLRECAATPLAARPSAGTLPLAALHTLVAGLPVGAEPGPTRDLDCLLRLPQIDPAVLRLALGRVRTHGRDWSVRDESAAIAKMLKTTPRLADADADVQSRALAVLLAGFGEDRFKAVNAPVRDWLLGHHPAP